MGKQELNTHCRRNILEAGIQGWSEGTEIRAADWVKTVKVPESKLISNTLPNPCYRYTEQPKKLGLDSCRDGKEAAFHSRASECHFGCLGWFLICVAEQLSTE